MQEPEPRYECRIGRIEADITTFWILGRMSWIATKLYNTALWSAKNAWKKTGKIPTGYDLQRAVFANRYHSHVPAHTYQHPAHQVGNAFKSWYKRRKNDVTARPPGYRKKWSEPQKVYNQLRNFPIYNLPSDFSNSSGVTYPIDE